MTFVFCSLFCVCTLVAYFADNMDSDWTVPKGTVLSGFIMYMFTFSNQAFNKSLVFSNFSWPDPGGHVSDINLIDSCQAHLPVQYASNLRSVVITGSNTCVARAKHTSCLFHLLSLFTLAFLFGTPTKPLLRLNIKNKFVLFHKL